MEKSEVIRRAEDLSKRCEKTGTVTFSKFLTPAEQMELRNELHPEGDSRMILFGGGAETERKAAFFLPFYVSDDEFDPYDAIGVMKIVPYFGTPGHRDYLGALLGMGVDRSCIGDIEITEEAAYVFCMKSVLGHLLSIEKIGKCGVKTMEVLPSEVPETERKVRTRTFPVMSMRLDAVVSGMFGISRSEAVRQISLGNVSLNYRSMEKADARVSQGDILSLKGYGKGSVVSTGGMSRKGRLFINSEIYQ